MVDMKRIIFCCSVLAVAFLVFKTLPAFASDNKTAETVKPKEIFSTTQHTIKVGRKKLHYTATAGQLILKDDSGKQKAQVFFIAYKKKDKNTAGRPVTFAFNGGPGSSSVWLHFGAIGPKRVRLKEDGSTPPPPAALIDNEFTWLAFTDVVFIDPVGTGYSRALDKKKEKQFFDFKKDIESVGDFIRLYLTRYNRWLSPRFIAGESYGTTRAVGLTKYLHKTHGIDLNGILLVSPVLDFNTIMFNSSNNLSYVLAFPTYTAAAWYHKRLPSKHMELNETLSEVENWVVNDYVVTLTKGNRLPPAQKEAIASRIANHTGLSQDYILKNNLKIPIGRFRKELFRNEKRVIGRMDARFTGPDTDAAGEASTYDPSLEMLIGIFSSAVNYYVRNDLKFESDIPYRYLNYSVSRAWDWSTGINHGQGYLNVSQALTDAIHINNHLRVFIASGYYDLATPYFAAKYTINHLGLDKDLRDNIRIRFYNAGHMMYIDLPSLKKLTADVSLFYKQTLLP
jgi:carboxypeptidase C (cathepsin A)